MISSVSRAVPFVTTPAQPSLFHSRMLKEPIEPTSAAGASSMTRAEPGLRTRANDSGESLSVPIAGPGVVGLDAQDAGRWPLRGHVAGGDGEADEPMSEVDGVAPERVDLRIHGAGVDEAHRVHSVDDVGDPQALEQSQDGLVFGLRVSRRGDIVPSGPKRFRIRRLGDLGGGRERERQDEQAKDDDHGNPPHDEMVPLRAGPRNPR